MSLEGEQLGEFEILEILGQGGMGAVYKARQTSLDRIVAIKTLQSALAGDALYIARFRQEAKAAARLNHPNLVQVYFAGENEGLHWFAMEYVEGESARARLKRKGRLEPLEAIAIAIHVATALDYSWRKASLIHRDVKPDNIFLSGEGEVKLGDLGLAKNLEQTQGLTISQASMGTPLYMSPEQVEGTKEVDLRTDIYSLGCTLYHLLSGQPPYSADSPMKVMMKQINAPVPDLRSVWPECPADLAAAVSMMMQKNPGARQQSYDEVSADLRQAYAELSGGSAVSVAGVTQPPAAVEKGRGVPAAMWAVAAVVVLCAAGAMLFFAPRKDRSPPTPALAGSALAQQALPPPTSSPQRPIGEEPAIVAPAPSPTAKPATDLADSTDRPVAGANTPQTTPGAVALPAATASPTPPANVVKASPKSAETAQATPLAKVDIPKWLEQIDAQYREPYQREVIKPYEEGMAQLKQGYVASIDRLLNAATQVAKLEDAITLRTERQRVAEGSGIPEDDLDRPLPSIKLLRAGYRAQAAKLEQARTQAAKAQFERYDKVLAAGQAQLTQRQRLDDAMLLKSRREQIADEWLGRAATPTAAATTTSTKPPSTPAIKQGTEGAPDRTPLPAGAGSVTTASKEAPFVSTLGMKFVPVPILGGPTGGQRVLFSIWDTRVQDYEVFAEETHRDWPKPDLPQDPTHPAVNVTWEDAQLFCQWLTARDQAAGRLPAGWSYRLPSDHEWSCAVEIGGREDAKKLPTEKNEKIANAFPWGSVWPPPTGAGNYAGEEMRAEQAAGEHAGIKDVIAGYNDGFVGTSPVGSFKANRFGLYDMGGNVWQWCVDWFDKEQKERVVRGASRGNYDRGNLLSSYRGRSEPADRDLYDGFRCVVGVSAR